MHEGVMGDYLYSTEWEKGIVANISALGNFMKLAGRG